MAKVWAAREREAPAPDAYEKSLAGIWRETGCAAEGAPYIIQGLFVPLVHHFSPFRDGSDAEKGLAAAFLDEVHCPGAHGLSEANRAKLKKIVTPTAPQAPKP
jgi:hypothetical protein